MSRTAPLVLVLTFGCGTTQYASRPVIIEPPGCAAPLQVVSTANGRAVGDDDALEDVLEDTLVFSRDGRKAAYVARQGKDWFVVHDGQRSRAWEGIGFLRYGEAGPVYAGQLGEEWCLHRGELEDSCFGSIYEDSVTLAGRSVAYVALSKDPWGPSETAASLVVDGAVTVRGAELALIRASEDGAIGVVDRGRVPDGLDKLYVGGAVVATAPRISDWSPAGGTTWVAVREGGTFVESAARTLGPYLRVSPLATRAGHVAFVGTTAVGLEVVLDGVHKAGPFPEVAVGTLVLSPSGEDFAIVVKQEGGEIKVATRSHLLTPVVGRSRVSSVSELVFSPDGLVLGTIAKAQNDQFTLALTTLATGEPLWSQGGFTGASDLALGPAGARLVALTRAEKITSVFEHCPGCNTPPKLTPLRAMPGTLVTDPALSMWAVLAGEGLPREPEARRMFIARSWGDGPIAFAPAIFGAAVSRFDRQGVPNPVVAAWRSQVRFQLTQHLGCPAQAP